MPVITSLVGCWVGGVAVAAAGVGCCCVNRASLLLSERSVPRGRLRPRPGRGSAAQSTHRELDSLPGGLRDPPGCTGDPVPVPSCSACSGRPVPHLSPDLKHSLTRTSPHLKRTRTPSCALHSNSMSTRSLAACARKQRESAMEKGPTQVGPTTQGSAPSSAPACPRLRVVRARVQSTSCALERVY